MIPARYIVAGALLVFAWKDAAVSVPWPVPNVQRAAAAKPPDEDLAWASQLRPIAAKMLPQDRQYMADFYEAVQFIVENDGKRSTPIIKDTDKFVVFHAGSLQLAIEKGKVGKYPGLDNAIDAVFFAACGVDVMPLGEKERDKIGRACNVLSWVFRVNGE